MADFGRRSPRTHSAYPVAESRRDRAVSLRTLSTVNLIWSVQGYINPHLGADTAFCVLEDTVTEAMPSDVRRRPAAGQWRGRPEVAALFITEVKRLTTRIAHGIVSPGSEAELVGILAPGVGKPAL